MSLSRLHNRAPALIVLPDKKSRLLAAGFFRTRFRFSLVSDLAMALPPAEHSQAQ